MSADLLILEFLCRSLSGDEAAAAPWMIRLATLARVTHGKAGFTPEPSEVPEGHAMTNGWTR